MEVEFEGRTLVVDDTFRNFVPETQEQRAEEVSQLIELVRHDGRFTSPISVWKGSNIVLDGHRRLLDVWPVVHDEGIEPPDIDELDFKDEAEAKQWMASNQWARRNLDRQSRAILRGQLFNAMKSATKNTSQAAKAVAAITGVSERQVRRNGAAEAGIEAIAKVDAKAANEIRGGKKRVSQQALAAAKSVSADTRQRAARTKGGKSFEQVIAEETAKRKPGVKLTDCDYATNKVEAFYGQLVRGVDDRFEICGTLHSKDHEICKGHLKQFWDAWIKATQG